MAQQAAGLDDVWDDWQDAVNMTPKQLREWLGTDDDVAHMRTGVGYVHRHIEQRPSGDVHDTRWRHSLMNWGHDPEKD